MSHAGRTLHVVTVLTLAVGVFVGVATGGTETRDPAAPAGPAAASAEVASAPTTTTFATESFAPSNSADTFEVHPVPPRVHPSAPTAPTSAGRAPSPTTAAPSNRPDNGGVVSAASDGSSAVASDVAPQIVAQLQRTVAVYASIGDRTASGALAATTEFGNPRVLPVVQQGGDWLRVELPTRPNGSLGWIRTRDVKLGSVRDRVDVDLAARSLTWTRDGVVQLQATVAIGAPASPTPAGDFFVTDVLPYPQGSAYGAWVVALDGHSDAFTEFEGGDARIAIHGTNDPSSIGRAASNGCVRVADGVLGVLAGALQAGTPVTIR